MQKSFFSRQQCKTYFLHGKEKKIKTFGLNFFHIMKKNLISNLFSAIPNDDPTPKIMPNIGYVLDGYDIIYGNPLKTSPTPDPGFRQSIFQATYSGKITPDQLYTVPDGMEIKSCSGTCSTTFGSSLISGTKSYKSLLDMKTSIDLGGFGGKPN